MRTEPSEPRKEFPLKLRDLQGNELGLILCDRKGKLTKEAIGQSANPSSVMRISQGSIGYSDFELPYTPILQDSWSGGRGAKVFETETTRYADSEGVDTSNGNIILQGKPVDITEDPRSWNNYTVGTADGVHDVDGTNLFIASKIVGNDVTIRSLTVEFIGAINSLMQAFIYTENTGTGLPENTLATSHTFRPTANPQIIEIPITCDMESGKNYFLVLQSGSVGSVRTRTGTGIGNIYIFDENDMFWSISTQGAGAGKQVIKMAYATGGVRRDHYFKYHGLTHRVSSYLDDGMDIVSRNGLIFMATANSTYRQVAVPSSVDMTGLSLTGKVVRIISGKGADQAQPWRKISSNSTLASSENYIYTYDDWDVPPDATSEIVVDGLDQWFRVFLISAPKIFKVSDVLVVNDIVYFARGDSQTIYRMRWTAGNYEFGTESSNADFLILCPKTSGGYQIWRAFRKTAMVAKAETVAWGTNLTFTDSNNGKPVSMTGAQITGMTIYGEPTIPYIMKEDGFGNIYNDIYADMPISNMIAKVASRLNGRATAVSDVYLLMSMAGGKIERYYDRHLDDIGPDRDEGLPIGRSGEISSIQTYPGRILAAVDAGGGTGTYSSVQMNNGQGWHEMYRSSEGERIINIYIQQIEGMYNRLLVSTAEKVVAIPFSTASPDPLKTADYIYRESGYIQSARIYGSMRDVRKFFKEMTVFTDYLTDCSVEVQFRTDENQTWRSAVEVLTVPMIDKTDLSVNYDVSGRWFEYRLILTRAIAGVDRYKTPIIDAVMIDVITRVPPKESWTIYFLLDDSLNDYQGKSVGKNAQDYIEQIRVWSDSRETPCPLKMYSMIPAFNNKLVCIEPGSFSPLYIEETGMTGNAVHTKMVGQLRIIGV